jgi:hypothetical protein
MQCSRSPTAIPPDRTPRKVPFWNSINGEEQLFNLKDDPQECRDLAGDSRCADVLAEWRPRMPGELEGREEGLSDGKKLMPGKVPVWRFGEADELHLG